MSEVKKPYPCGGMAFDGDGATGAGGHCQGDSWRNGIILMVQPRLLLIDDEPALAEFLASAARECGFAPSIAVNEQDFQDKFAAEAPAMVALDLGMPKMDGVEFLRFLAGSAFAGPVLIISGFDRRVLESAIRLGEALGLNMVGPLEKPARLADVETLLNELKPSLETTG